MFIYPLTLRLRKPRGLTMEVFATTKIQPQGAGS
jgi:hypothetical protein